SVLDSTPPVVTLNGPATVDVIRFQPYSDQGATADDSCAGELTPSIVVNNPVNSAALGTYTVTYSATDPSNNVGTAQRTVRVLARPVITINGSTPMEVECGSFFNDPGAT